MFFLFSNLGRQTWVMRKVLVSSVLALLLASCYKYQYMVISSSATDKAGANRFHAETDSVRVEYSFNGDRGRPDITVINNSASPVMIDWQNSFYITNEKPEVLYKPQKTITGELVSVNQQTGSFTLKTGEASPAAVQSIPPQTRISRQFDPVVRTGYMKLNFTPDEKERIVRYGMKKKAWRKDFSEESSPQVFRIYLSLLEKSGKTRVLDRSFYISSVIASHMKPGTFAGDSPDNIISVRGSTAAGMVSEAAGITAALTAVIIGVAKN